MRAMPKKVRCRKRHQNREGPPDNLSHSESIRLRLRQIPKDQAHWQSQVSIHPEHEWLFGVPDCPFQALFHPFLAATRASKTSWMRPWIPLSGSKRKSRCQSESPGNPLRGRKRRNWAPRPSEVKLEPRRKRPDLASDPGLQRWRKWPRNSRWH